MILAFGIISLVFFHCLVGLVFGILAWVMGNSDLKGMADGEVDPEGKQLTQVGRILGIVGLAISALYTLFIAAYFVFIFAVVAAVPKGPPPAAPVPVPAPAPAPPPPPIKGAGALLVPTLCVGTHGRDAPRPRSSEPVSPRDAGTAHRAVLARDAERRPLPFPRGAWEREGLPALC
jgi:hypothetical protein